jgi:uncharacterized protein (UPF0333 family)
MKIIYTLLLALLLLGNVNTFSSPPMTNTTQVVMAKIQIKEQEKKIFNITNGYPRSFIANVEPGNNDKTINTLSNVWWQYEVEMTNLMKIQLELKNLVEKK